MQAPPRQRPLNDRYPSRRTSIIKRGGLRPWAGRDGIDVELRARRRGDRTVCAASASRRRQPRARRLLPATIGRLYLISRGSPREINRLCERALVDGASRTAKVVDAALIDRAAQDLSVQVPAANARPVRRRWVMAIAILAVTLLAATVASAVFDDAVAAAVRQ